MLNDVKNYLNITWEDESTERKLESMIARGKAYLSARAGKELNFNEEGLSKTLLLNYVMYENSGCLDDFFQNYHSEILSLRLLTEVEYAKTKE